MPKPVVIVNLILDIVPVLFAANYFIGKILHHITNSETKNNVTAKAFLDGFKILLYSSNMCCEKLPEDDWREDMQKKND